VGCVVNTSYGAPALTPRSGGMHAVGQPRANRYRHRSAFADNSSSGGNATSLMYSTHPLPLSPLNSGSQNSKHVLAQFRSWWEREKLIEHLPPLALQATLRRTVNPNLRLCGFNRVRFPLSAASSGDESPNMSCVRVVMHCLD
jgi:hypothetical protein